jgi:hypothetical protein
MAAKIVIPEDLKKDLPPSKWGKILGATPIIMTVIATMLAGLASSEMTKAQYDRSAAAQLQSKAGDQWGYFQAKKMRSAINRDSFESTEGSVDTLSLESELLEQKISHEAFRALFGGQAPVPLVTKLEADVKAALDALDQQKSDAEIAAVLLKISPEKLATALATARQDALDYDKVIKPLDRTINIELKPVFLSFYKEKLRAFNAACFRYRADRYDAESALNATIGKLLELQVRQENISAERHHKRSGKFFFGMLAAQMAVIISTFAIAARQKNFLWSVAATAGLVAVSFSVYVYLCF